MSQNDLAFAEAFWNDIRRHVLDDDTECFGHSKTEEISMYDQRAGKGLTVI